MKRHTLLLTLLFFVAPFYVNAAGGYCDSRWYGQVDLLAWKVCQSDNDYAIRLNGEFNESDFNSYAAELSDEEHAEFDWEAGFRVLLGYQCDNNTSAELELTGIFPSVDAEKKLPSINGSASSAYAASRGKINFPDTENIYRIAQADSSIDYYTLVGRVVFPLCLQPCLEISPFTGVMILSANQEFNTRYYDNSYTLYNGSQWESDYLAAGLEAGVRSRWFVSSCWAIDAVASLSALYGKTDETYKNTSEINSSSTYSSRIDRCDSTVGIRLALGATYAFCLCGCDLDFTIAYESNTWSYLPHPPRWPNDVAIGYLIPGQSRVGLHGLTLGLSGRF